MERDVAAALARTAAIAFVFRTFDQFIDATVTQERLIVAAGLLAAWLPARRAARLDPATILREG